MTPTLEADPDCARPEAAPRSTAVRRPFESISPATWDALAAASPAATPFASWAFHRAWWDGYGENAHDQTLVVARSGPTDPGGHDPATDPAPLAIVPLMHRHVVEPDDLATETHLRHGHEPELTPLPPSAKVVYFGASYHADYATVLAAPDDLPVAAESVADALAGSTALDPDHPEPWDAIDLRRLRVADPAADALARAFGAREIDCGWTLNLEPEDVCPVVRLQPGADFETCLGTLSKKERHEIRRKVRRAEATGPVELVESTDPLADLEAFIDLHQRRWRDDGLFPDTRGGAHSRVFVRRLFELFPSPLGTIHLTFLMVGDRRVAAGIHFETADTLLFYNAGIDPDARPLSPGVCLTERMLRRAIERGLTRFDFLRGNEPYKYDWGAVDEPIQRLLVRRTVQR